MDKDIHKSVDDKYIPMTSIGSGVGHEASSDIYYYTDQIANFILVGESSDEWVLIDAGLPKGAEAIRTAVIERFGEKTKPKAIILTHGHFDHVGGLVDVLEEWQVPVYAHELEVPYLTGEESYPEPDTTVEGGLLAKISAIYPNEPIDIGPYLKTLPDDHQVPEMSGWKWIHTPGHSPGHVSFFRESDGLLLAGDAFTTVRQDSFYKVMMQDAEINGPPRYLTTDWEAAWESVKKLHQLHPQLAITGHGPAMEGEDLKEGLENLVQTFDEIAIPDYGKYVHDDDQLH